MSNIEDKIRGLIALAKQECNANEAANAWAAAQRLATIHALDLDALSMPEESEPEKPIGPIVVERLELFGLKRTPWKLTLAMALAAANSCRVYTSKISRTEIVMNTYGQSSDVATVRSIYPSIVAQCDMATRLAVDAWKNDPDADPETDESPRAYANSFRIGFSHAIANRLAEVTPRAVVKALAAAGTSSVAIVRAESRIERISAALDVKSKAIGLKPGRAVGGASRGSGYAAGRAAGSGASIAARAALGGGS